MNTLYPSTNPYLALLFFLIVCQSGSSDPTIPSPVPFMGIIQDVENVQDDIDTECGPSKIQPCR